MSKNEIKNQVIYLCVCYWPGLEDYSSRPIGIVSRSSVVLSVEGVLSVEREEVGSLKSIRYSRYREIAFVAFIIFLCCVL